MEKSRSSSKPLEMHEIQQLPGHRMRAAGQHCLAWQVVGTDASQAARPLFQDRGHESLDQVWYTWHQRRRLKKLQIRYLARKFFYLWAKKTFGQVLPSKARYFYVQKILQKTFGEWKEWWTAGRERQLSLRAASHYRRFLHNLIFKAWRVYVCQQQGKRNKYHFAESHDSLFCNGFVLPVKVPVLAAPSFGFRDCFPEAKKQKLLGAWQHWLVYVGVQRTKHGMQSVALAFREKSCLRASWTMWRRQHYQNRTRRKMNVLALQYWAQSLQFRAWLQWRELYLYIQNDKQKETRAVTHHQNWELKRYMEAWLGYLNLHRAKKIEYGVVLCVEESRQCELAEKHYRCHLLKLGFKSLWQNVLNTRIHQMRKNLSYRQHEVTLLYKFWSHWKYRLEEEEEQQQQALTSVAHARYRRVLMRQVFDTWMLNTRKQQEYRVGERRAVLHFERQLLRCSWCFWRRRTAAHLKEQEVLVRARDHYSNLLLLKSFCLWKQNTRERKIERLKERQAVRFHYSKCLRQTWNKWREHMEHQREKWRKLVRADMHYRHTLLGKTLGAWKSYQHNIQCILYQVAEKEKQHMRLLLRQLLCTWRENALALICEAKATTRADEHYRRVVLSKAVVQWRSAASLQVCCRQWKVTAVMEARKHLDIVRLQTLFLHWKELTRESLMLKAQQHKAVQHHQQHLTQKYLMKWKKYHQYCLGKMLLQRLGNQLMTHRLCSASFSCWKTRLLQQQWEKQKTVQALWHWSLTLQTKVFSAWLRFAKGQQQKKDPLEKAKGVYHTSLLNEGLTEVLRYTTDIRQFQGHLQAQHQQKVKEKKATFDMAHVSPETRGRSAEEELWPSKRSGLPFHLAYGDSVLSHLNAIQQARLPPPRPDFLLESPESKELLGPTLTRSEAPFQQTSLKRCSAQTGDLMLTPEMEESTCRCWSRMGGTNSCPSLTHAAFPSAPLRTHGVHRAVQRPELWSPSSFMPHMKAGAEMRRGQPVSGHKAHSQDSQEDSAEKRLQPNLQSHLLSPEELVGKWRCQTAAEVEKREQGSREGTVLQRKLEAELQHIQQQMQYYYSRKQELRCCLQQAQILQKWLEMGMHPEDSDGVQGVQEQLDQLQVRISALTEAQPQERRCVQNLVARLHDLQLALDV